MKVLNNKFFLGLAFLAFIQSKAFSFVLINGGYESKLPVSKENPEIVFHWNGVGTELEKIEELFPGQEDLTNEEAVQLLLQMAASHWNNVYDSYIQITIERDTTAVLDSEDKVFAIVVENESNQTSSASALPSYSEDLETIEDCDIKVNRRTFDAGDLGYTLTHELGHCLGLGHPHHSYQSIMSYSRDAMDIRLGVDDMAGIIYLYPNTDDGKIESKELIACAAINTITSSNSIQTQLWFFFLLGLPIGVAMLHRKRHKPII